MRRKKKPVVVRKKMPAGIQDFEKLRTNGYLYVDKTQYVYQLSREHCPYFLIRPRRFGKSLLLSTFKAYFLGKRELFDGLAIARLEKEWKKYPVFHLDMNVEDYTGIESLYSALDTNLRALEGKWGRDEREESPAARFYGLIRRASVQAGCKVVVLVDEYDKPLLNILDDMDDENPVCKALKGFYGVLKSADAYLRFVFLTGVTKFSKMSIFSELNHLNDISLNANYASICGISDSEFADLKPEAKRLAPKLGMTYREMLDELNKRYNGYHFARMTKKSEGIYNPYSLLRTFKDGELLDYWFETGTPTFFVKMLKDIDFDITKLEKDVVIPARALFEYRYSVNNPIPLLYQLGYLTIQDYDKLYEAYILGFPNDEVRYGFFNELLPVYIPNVNMQGDFFVMNFVNDLQNGNIEGFMNRLKAFFADISDDADMDAKTEKYYQTIFYILIKLMGQFVEVEEKNASGCADAVIITEYDVYVFEFKLTEDVTAEDALKQIDGQGYLIPFSADDKRLVKIGAEFSTQLRGLTRWVVKS
jgi:hypothetical protein